MKRKDNTTWKHRLVVGLSVIVLMGLFFRGIKVTWDIQTAQANETSQPSALEPAADSEPSQPLAGMKITYTVSATPIPTPEFTTASDWDTFLVTELLPLTRKYGIPDQLAAAQAALESGRTVRRADNNHFGIGPGWKFATLDKAVEVYARSLRNILKRKGYDLDSISDPLEIVQKLQEGTPRYEGHSSKPWEYAVLLSGTPEWRAYAKGSIWKL